MGHFEPVCRTGQWNSYQDILRNRAFAAYELSSEFCHPSLATKLRSCTIQIVNKHSAVLHRRNEVAVPMLNTNHRTICQFQDRGCPNYTLLKTALQDLRSAASAAKTKPNQDDEAKIRVVSVRLRGPV